MKLQDFLSESIESPGPPRGRGVETDWLDVDTLPLESGLLWIGDPQCSWSETQDDDCSISLPPGSYRLLAKGIDIGGKRFVSRIRLLSAMVLEDVSLGDEIADTGTDSGRLGVADCVAIRTAYEATCGDDDDEFLDMVEDGVTGHIGVFQPDPEGESRLLYLRSGMGDGSCSVVQVVSQAGDLVGVECEFIDAEIEW